MSIDVMKQALEAMEHLHRTGDTQVFDMCYAPELIPALRTAIEQAEKQEPFGYFQYAMHFDAWVQNRDSNKGVAFYTTPPAAPVQERNFCERCGKRLGGDGHIHTCTPPEAQRQWVGLAPHEIGNLWAFAWAGDRVAFACAIEAKLKEKNT